MISNFLASSRQSLADDPREPLSVSLFALALSLAFASLLLTHDRLLTYDSWWHFAMGSQILREHSLTPHEIFSFTSPGTELHYHAWLSGVVFEMIRDSFGLGFLECTNALLVGITGFLVFRISCALGGDRIISLFAIPIFYGLSTPFLIIRPQLFTFFFLMLIINCYCRRKRYSCWHLIVLFFNFSLWSNLHGGYVVGIAVLAALTIFEFAFHCTNARFYRLSSASLFAQTSIATLGSLIHPEGVYQLYNVFAHDPLAHGINQHIDEWLSPQTAVVVLIALTATLGIVLSLRHHQIVKALPLSGMAILAMFHWRHVPFFCLIGIPLVISLIPIRTKIRIKLSWLTTLCATLFIMQCFIKANTSEYEILNSIRSRQVLPVAAVSFLNEHQLSNRLFNPYHWGGFLLYSLYPKYSIYIDSRLSPYHNIMPDEYFRIWNGTPDAERLLNNWQIETVILSWESPLTERLFASKNWIVAHQDATSVLFKKIVASLASS